MGFLPSCGCISTTDNKMHREKAKWELHKNAMCCFESILEAAPHKTVTAYPLASHLTNHQRKTNKTCLSHSWRSKDNLQSNVLLWTHTHTCTRLG